MFSIGIPAYKGRDLRECIDSILAQTYKDFELIIVNDCSPDPIEDIIKEYDDLRIQYHKNEKNFGAEHVVLNWNKCLGFAKGDYFVLMGDDDTMEPNYLEEFVNLINTYPKLDVFHCRSSIIDESSNKYYLTPTSPNYEDIYDYITNCIAAKRVQFVSDFVYRTSVLKEIGGFYKLPLAWSSDYLTSFAASKEHGIAHTNKAIFNYRSHPNSITSKGNIEKKAEAYALYFEWIENFLSVKPKDNLLLIKHRILVETLDKAILGEKQNIIRSTIGSGNVFNGFLKCFALRKKYNLKFSDLIASIAASILVRITKRDKIES